jgi:hypothetical protein
MVGRKPGTPKTGGRKPGTPNRLTLALRERIAATADPFDFLVKVMRGEGIPAAPLKDAPEQVLTYPTLDQRISAGRILADKLLPNAKDRPIQIDLPVLKSPADVLSAQAAIVAAMGRGEITPDEANTVAGVVELKRRAIETVEHERRLAALEAVRNGKSG